MTERDSPSNEVVLEELRRLQESCQGKLTTTYTRENGEFSVGMYQSRFGSWNNALREANIQPNRRTDVSESELINHLEELADEFGRAPTNTEMDGLGEFSASTYIRRFGSWNEAVKEAGLDPNMNRDLSKSALLHDLRDLSERLGRTPTNRDVTEHGKFAANSYQRVFGALTEAQKMCGLEVNRGMVFFECDQCGEKASKDKHLFEEQSLHFCNRECYDEYRKELGVGDHPLSDRVPVECEYCGQEMFVKKYRSEQERLFCGRECMGEYRSSQTGEEAHAWCGGYSPHYYGPNWNEARRRCRERDDYTCQGCGVEEDELDRELSVHHITPFREFIPEDGEPDFEAANDLDNLVSLCERCHSKYEGVPIRPEVTQKASG